MIDRPFDEQGQRFARSYSQTSPFRDTEQRQKRVLQTALGGSDQMLQNPFEMSPDGQSAERTGGSPPQRAIQRQQAPGLTGYGGNTGVAGGLSNVASSVGQMVAGLTAKSGLGQFAGKLEGFDSGKLNSAHDSPKYQFGRVMSQFNPQGGITQEMLDALNALGLGTVSGQIGGDKISIGGNVDPRFEGVTEFDIIRDLENGGGWQWGGVGGPAAGGGGPIAQQAFGMPVSINPNVSIGTPEGARSYLEQILAALQGNPALARALSGRL